MQVQATVCSVASFQARGQERWWWDPEQPQLVTASSAQLVIAVNSDRERVLARNTSTFGGEGVSLADRTSGFYVTLKKQLKPRKEQRL